jgi:SAM-dependent methyltransferase
VSSAFSDCPVCGGTLNGPTAGFRYDCADCAYACADPQAVSGGQAAPRLHEDRREAALAPLRARNFEIVLDRLAACGARSGTLLDVGCAHGWFLDAARRRGYRVSGIEPDSAVASQAVTRGHDVAHGLFPAVLPAGAKFDVVVFNDVFEHLPDPRGAFRAIAGALRPGGLLAVNLPNSRGVFYRLADALRGLGWRAPHDRLWQVGFPSPHLSYFHPEALARLASGCGFEEVERRALPSIACRGLWQRLRYDARASSLSCAITWLAVSVAVPVVRVLPPDISLTIFRRLPAAGDAPQRVDTVAGASEGGNAGVITPTR